LQLKNYTYICIGFSCESDRPGGFPELKFWVMITITLRSEVIKMAKRSNDMDELALRINDFGEIHELDLPTTFEMVQYGKEIWAKVKSQLGMAILG